MSEWTMTEPGVMGVPLPDQPKAKRANFHRTEKFDTIDTISTGAGFSGIPSALESVLNTENVEAGDLKDSLLAREVAAELQDWLALDETAGDWFTCAGGIWKPITKIRATKIINKTLHGFLPDGFSMSKLNAIEGFLKLYLALDKWESDKALLPLQNGILDTKTLTLAPYSANHKFNWQLPYAYGSGSGNQGYFPMARGRNQPGR